MIAAHSLRGKGLSPGISGFNSFGGKGNALVRIAEAGLPVPNTALFDLDEVENWLESWSLQNDLGFAEAHEDLQTWKEKGKAIKNFRNRLLLTEAPEGWEKWITKLCRELRVSPSESLIVRSSMSLEDAGLGNGSEGGDSFAGCFESVRVIQISPAAVWNACLRVIASLYTPESARRVLSAPASSGATSRARPGFLIQKYIEGNFSGVCFSRDPEKIWTRQSCLEWGVGGDSVVQGKTKTGFVREGEKAGLEMPLELARVQSLFWFYAKHCENILKAPVDLEWVLDDQKLWLVQARPISTAEARLAARTPPGGRWSRELTLERFPKPLTPMGWSILQDSLEANLLSLDRRFGIIARGTENMAVSVHGVIYADPDFFNFPSGVRIRWLHYFSPWKRVCRRIIKDGIKWISQLFTLSVQRKDRKQREGVKARIAAEATEILLFDEADRISKTWESHRDHSLKVIQEFRDELKANPPVSAPAALAAMDRPSILAAMDRSAILVAMERLKKLSLDFLEPDLGIFLIKDTIYKSVEKLWTAQGLEQTLFSSLFQTSRGNRTLEMAAEWSELIRSLQEDRSSREFLKILSHSKKAERKNSDQNFEYRIAADQVLGPRAREEWRKFITRNGHCTTSWDIFLPSWGEDPAQLVPLLEAAISREGRTLISQDEARSKAHDLFRVSLGSAWPRIEALIERVEEFMCLDEELHFLTGLLLELSRTLIRSGAEVLIQSGRLENLDEVYFITLPELKRALAGDNRYLHFLAERRRSEWERAFQREFPMNLAMNLPVNLGEETPVEGESGVCSSAFKGLPVSTGIATGPIHFAEHVQDVSQLPKGAILYTLSPNPALAPVFPLLGGLISATGGPLSHGFVAAREYGLPAVSGIPASWVSQLQPGTLVHVDGKEGTVGRAS